MSQHLQETPPADPTTACFSRELDSSVEPLKDNFDRIISYARFSLTEACNLTCTYCLPKGFPQWLKYKAKLGIEEISIILQGLKYCGIKKIRFTGGEPTIHPKALDAVRMAQKLEFGEISLTTNGLLIKDLKEWRRSGLTSINISLDSLEEKIFQEITGSAHLKKVLSTISEALQIGLKTKINTVLMRSINGNPKSIKQLINWAKLLPITLRFIELMPTDLNRSFAKDERIIGAEIEQILNDLGFSPLKKELSSLHSGPASEWDHPNFPGKIGLINPLSCNFCAKCNRIRIRANGHLKLCLFGATDIPLPLDSAKNVESTIRKVISQKPEKHLLNQNVSGNVATFRTIGG